MKNKEINQKDARKITIKKPLVLTNGRRHQNLILGFKTFFCGCHDVFWGKTQIF